MYIVKATNLQALILAGTGAVLVQKAQELQVKSEADRALWRAAGCPSSGPLFEAVTDDFNQACETLMEIDRLTMQLQALENQPCMLCGKVHGAEDQH